MKKSALELETKDIDHCGIVAGIVDELGLVEEIDRRVGVHPQQVVSTGQVVKAMILNGLGFVAAPLYSQIDGQSPVDYPCTSYS